MDLEALRAQARAVASRMETRLSTALGENRELNTAEQQANGTDEAELAELKSKIIAAEAAAAEAGDPAKGNDPGTVATAAERARIMGLVDLCPASVMATPLRTAIEKGTEPGAFAIDLATAAKARGASVADLRAGAVGSEQLPDAAPAGATAGAKTGADQAKDIIAFAAAAGHSAFKHLAKAG